MRRQKGDSGITLIELILVVSLIAILMSMVIPKIEKNNYWLVSSSRMLRDEIRNIRYMKMVEGKSYKILLEDNKYFIIENGRQIKEVKLEKNLKFAHNITGGNIYFSHIGAPQQGGTIKILNIKTNKYCEITIVPATGRVLLKNQIFEGYIRN